MPTKIRNETATQVSAASKSDITGPSALEGFVDRRRDGGRGRYRADQPLDDRGRGVDRDGAHIGHCGGLGRGDLLLGLGKLGVELRLERLAALLAFRVELV